MSKLFSTVLFLVVLSSFAYSQQRQPCVTANDVRIEKDKPTVFITFERYGKAVNLSEQRMVETDNGSKSKEKGKDVWLRVYNNTCWNLKFIQYGMFIPKQKVGENPGERFKRIGILDDGAETSLFYTVVKADGKTFYVGIDSYDYVTLPAGTSLLFSVEREHLAKDQSVRVRYLYAWEFQQGKSYVVNEPEHILEFRNYDLEEQSEK